jgi:hypothetical protein
MKVPHSLRWHGAQINFLNAGFLLSEKAGFQLIASYYGRR